MAWRAFRKRPLVIWAKQMREDFEVETLEGKMQGRAGDYLVRGVEGEEYPCRRDIFERTYERALDYEKSGGPAGA